MASDNEQMDAVLAPTLILYTQPQPNGNEEILLVHPRELVLNLATKAAFTLIAPNTKRKTKKNLSLKTIHKRHPVYKGTPKHFFCLCERSFR